MTSFSDANIGQNRDRVSLEEALDLSSFTQDELLHVEYALRKITDREKSPNGLRLAMAFVAELRRRYEATLSTSDSPNP
ncbi:MAG TPA: hypothetical protein VGN57_01565 [Pirellulaceae bacterium]|jgi:hypothetical protein|nr:hypothetical protein [Pirellulaceae bacterium]